MKCFDAVHKKLTLAEVAVAIGLLDGNEMVSVAQAAAKRILAINVSVGSRPHRMSAKERRKDYLPKLLRGQADRSGMVQWSLSAALLR
jgi:hypothetical protein